MDAQATRLPAASGRGEDDSLFLAALRAREEAAYAALVRRYRGRVLSVTRRILRDEEEARDATQETFLLAFRAMDRFCGAARLSTWLHRIAVNCALMKLRAAASRRLDQPVQEALREGLLAGALHPYLAGGDPQRAGDAGLERRQLGQDLNAAIARLPESYRAVLLLRDVEELDTGETARRLGISPANVKVRLHRARLTLRRMLCGGAVYRGGGPR